MYTTMKVNITNENAALLRRTAAEQGADVNDIVDTAAALYTHLLAAQTASGKIKIVNRRRGFVEKIRLGRRHSWRPLQP